MSELMKRLVSVGCDAITADGDVGDRDVEAIIRAALQELRDNPTEAIIRVAKAYEHDFDGDDLVRRDWSAMIDKALEE